MFDQMMYDGLQRKNEKLRGKLDAQVTECRELKEVNEELQRKNEKLRGKLVAQVTKYRDLEGVYAELQECICELED